MYDELVNIQFQSKGERGSIGCGRRETMIITVDLFDVIILAVGGALLLICGIILAIGTIRERRKEKKCKK